MKQVNLWFEGLLMKRCPTCKKNTQGQVVGWYEYIRGKRNLVLHFCRNCFEGYVLGRINALQNGNTKYIVAGYRYCPKYIWACQESVDCQQRFLVGYDAAQSHTGFYTVLPEQTASEWDCWDSRRTKGQPRGYIPARVINLPPIISVPRYLLGTEVPRISRTSPHLSLICPLPSEFD